MRLLPRAKYAILLREMKPPDYFIPDRDPRAFYPLSSYLPIPSASVAHTYIEHLTSPGDLVIAPFACAPTVARVATALGRRVISVEANPLWAWLARAMATLPPASELDAALARLGDALKDDAPLRVHIAQLYATVCAACGKTTPADYFIHARGAGVSARHYTCASCGETRDDPATEDDLKRATLFDARGLHYHLAFTRLAPQDGLRAERIRKMLDVYTPRNLYALVTLTQKIDSLFHAMRERDILLLLLLHLLDRGASFYANAEPGTPARLTAHKQFIEFNLWHEIEIAVRELGRAAPALDLAATPDEAIHAEMPLALVEQGNARSLAHTIPSGSAALVIAALPTRRVAVWALSYFWGAWILGRAAAQSLLPFLDASKDATWERRWYFDSLVNSTNALAKLLRPDAHAIFAFSESWCEPIESLLLAASGAHLDLDTFVFQPRLGDFPRRELDDLRGEYRISFVPSPVRETNGEGTGVGVESRIRASARAAGEEILARRGEPLAFSWLHHAAYTRLAREGILAQAMAAKFKTPPGRIVHNAVVAGLKEGYAHDFDHYESPAQFLWMRHARDLAAPLIERVEDAVREILVRDPSIALEELQDAIYRQFPGDLTPEAGLIEMGAAAYAERDETERARALDILARLGERLGYKISDFRFQISEIQDSESPRPASLASRHFDLAWLADGELAHGFIWRARAQFADLAQIHIAPARGYVIVPENQVALMRAKTQRMPHLADAFHEAGWSFVRVPFAEKLLNAEKIEQHDLVFLTGLAPNLEQKTQLELFDNAE
ncbi:hypothetical protein ANRL1_00064 [Anaerolineae bacterium]|nr:hypothetical protein ANRL1_00064 [Anaerolineae bacterium]